ncbi:MAG: phosphotransferase [Oscillospiraceae bacterium]
MRILAHFPPYRFDIGRFTCANTHGDFIITQLICGEGRINGVIDWTTACVHPIVWEIIRSYVYASPLCINGEIDIADLTDYVRIYLVHGKLNSYDLENMAQLFFYFTAVCDFYGQYYDSLTRNRAIYLQQAKLSSKLLRWFDAHAEELREALQGIAIENERA